MKTSKIFQEKIIAIISSDYHFLTNQFLMKHSSFTGILVNNNGKKEYYIGQWRYEKDEYYAALPKITYSQPNLKENQLIFSHQTQNDFFAKT